MNHRHTWTIDTLTGIHRVSLAPASALRARRNVGSEGARALEGWIQEAKRPGRARAMLEDVASALRWAYGSEASEERILRRALQDGILRLEQLPARVPRSREDRLEVIVQERARTPEELTWIALHLEYDDGDHEGVAYARYLVLLPDGSRREGTLDRFGNARLDGIPPGNCDVSFPDYDQRAGAPPPPVAPGEPWRLRAPASIDHLDGGGELEAPCTLHRVEVVCAHEYENKSRKFKLIATEERADKAFIEVVGGTADKGDTIRVTLRGTVGACGLPEHVGSPITIEDDEANLTRFGSGETAMVSISQDIDREGIFGTWETTRTYVSPVIAVRTLGILWRWLQGDIPVREYWLHVDACHGALQAIPVRVYPDLELKAVIGLSWGTKYENKVDGDDRSVEAKTEREIVVTGSLGYKFNGVEHVASQELLREGFNTQGFGRLFAFVGAVREKLLATGIEVKFPLLNLTCSVALKNEEEVRGPKVHTIGEVAFDGSIGGAFEVDFIDVVLRWARAGSAGTVVGPVVLSALIKLKSELKRHNIAEIALGLGLRLDGIGGVKAKFEAGECTCSGNLGARAEIKVFGKAMVKVDVPLVKYFPIAHDYALMEMGVAAEGTAGGRVEIIIDRDERGLYWGTRTYFEGLKVEVAAVMGFKSKTLPKKPEPHEDTPTKANKAAWSVTWFEPHLNDPDLLRHKSYFFDDGDDDDDDDGDGWSPHIDDDGDES